MFVENMQIMKKVVGAWQVLFPVYRYLQKLTYVEKYYQVSVQFYN